MPSSFRMLPLARTLVMCLFVSAPCAQSFDVDRLDEPTRISEGWRIMHDDKSAYASPGYDDSSWDAITSGSIVKLRADGYFWLRTEFVPATSLRSERLYAFLGKFPCPSEFYLNGSIVATRGEFPPSYSVPISDPVDFLLPNGLIRWGERNIIAIRANYKGTEFQMTSGAIGGEAHYRFEKNILELFNTRLYYIFAAINLFAGIFFILQFAYRTKEHANLLFAFSSIFMAIYFYEMGTPRMIIPAWWMRGLSKASLALSCSLFVVFCVTYFNIHNRKIVKGIAYASGVGWATALMMAPDETILLGTFQVMLIPIMLAVLFAFYLILRAVMRGDANARPILAGSIIGLSLSTYDIACNFMGVEPFAWLEGIGFFAINQSLFVSLAIRSAKAFNALEDYSIQIENKKNELFMTNSAFSRFVPQEFLRFLGKDNVVEIKLGDQVMKEMTILFSDIRSFTTISEKMSPAENFNFLNNYLSRVVPVIREQNGIIDKYIGDGLMALFPDSPDHALRSAINLLRAVRSYNEGRVRAGYMPIEIGVGIHTGSLMLGTIGEPHRMDTTVISDVVNVASRLEDLTKQFQVPILASGQVIENIPDAREKYTLRYLGQVLVKGKEMRVPIYEVIVEPDLPENKVKLAMRERFERAVFQYDSGDTEAARTSFIELAPMCGNDHALAYYLKITKSAPETELLSVEDI